MLLDLADGTDYKPLCPKCSAELNWPRLTIEQFNDVVERLGHDMELRQRLVEFAVTHGFQFYLPEGP